MHANCQLFVCLAFDIPLLARCIIRLHRLQACIMLSAIKTQAIMLLILLQVITTFLGSLLVGSFLNQITAFLDDPKGIVNTLGTSAPQTATFFMTYILVQAFIKHPFQLLRLPGLIFFWLKYRLATTPRQKAAVWQDTHLKYGTNVSTLHTSELAGLRILALLATVHVEQMYKYHSCL